MVPLIIGVSLTLLGVVLVRWSEFIGRIGTTYLYSLLDEEANAFLSKVIGYVCIASGTISLLAAAL